MICSKISKTQKPQKNSFNSRYQLWIIKLHTRLSLLLITLLLSMPLPGLGQDADQPAGFTAALQAVLANHPAIRGKQAELNAYRSDLDVYRAGRYPTLSANAKYQDNDYRQTTLGLHQPVYAFGKINTPIERASAEVAAETTDLLRVQRQLLEETALAYGRIEGIRRREAIAAANVEKQQQLFDQIERRYQGQLASEADVQLASSRLAQALADREQIRSELRIALTNLRNLTRVSVDVSEPVPRGLTALPAPENIEAAVLSASAELALAQQKVTVARITIKERRAASMPTLYLAVEQDLFDETMDGDESRVSLNLTGRLDGMGLADSNRVAGASARADAAEQNLAAIRNDLCRQVDNLITSRTLQQTLLKAQHESVEALAATRDSYERQYAAGHKSWLDLLNIQRELTQQQLRLAQVENEELLLTLRLVNLVGGLDQAAQIQHPLDRK